MHPTFLHFLQFLFHRKCLWRNSWNWNHYQKHLTSCPFCGCSIVSFMKHTLKSKKSPFLFFSIPACNLKCFHDIFASIFNFLWPSIDNQNFDWCSNDNLFSSVFLFSMHYFVLRSFFSSFSSQGLSMSCVLRWALFGSFFFF
jgi:hypothetical protein